VPNLEQVVRPSETQNIRPAYPSFARTKPVVQPDDDFVWGTAGNDVFALNAQSKADVNNQTSQEIQRTFDTVRIKSASDPSTYVDVEVMTAYQAKNVIDKTRTALRFTPPQGSENVEVIRRNTTRTTNTEG